MQGPKTQSPFQALTSSSPSSFFHTIEVADSFLWCIRPSSYANHRNTWLESWFKIIINNNLFRNLQDSVLALLCAGLFSLHKKKSCFFFLMNKRGDWDIWGIFVDLKILMSYCILKKKYIIYKINLVRRERFLSKNIVTVC
jgi:hypothetical protein